MTFAADHLCLDLYKELRLKRELFVNYKITNPQIKFYKTALF